MKRPLLLVGMVMVQVSELGAAEAAVREVAADDGAVEAPVSEVFEALGLVGFDSLCVGLTAARLASLVAASRRTSARAAMYRLLPDEIIAAVFELRVALL